MIKILISFNDCLLPNRGENLNPPAVQDTLLCIIIQCTHVVHLLNKLKYKLRNKPKIIKHAFIFFTVPNTIAITVSTLISIHLGGGGGRQKKENKLNLRLKLRLIEAATSPILFLALTLYRPASVSMTSSSSSTTRNLFVSTLWILKLVLASSLSWVSPRNQDMSGFGELTSWHSKMSRFPSSSWRSCGFWVKLGAKSSATPMSSGCLRSSSHFHGVSNPFSTRIVQDFRPSRPPEKISPPVSPLRFKGYCCPLSFNSLAPATVGNSFSPVNPESFCWFCKRK